MSNRRTLSAAITAVFGLLGLASSPCLAQDYDGSAPPVAVQVDQAAQLSDDQIDQVLQPIALYPDPLLAEILPASTYPLEIVEAYQWLQNNPDASDDDIAAQAWDPSVKAMVHYPDVLKTMATNSQWTQTLGAAFMNQQADVTAGIQRLRREALDAGNLTSTPEQQVIVTDDCIQILPADPDAIYVPDYDPTIIYVRQRERPHWRFFKHRIGIWLTFGFDWGQNELIFGYGWHPGWDLDGRNWRRKEIVRDDPVVKVWSHDRAKPLPRMPESVVGHKQGPARNAAHDLPVVPRVGPMKEPDRQVTRGKETREPSVIEQNASETRQAVERYHKDRAEPANPPAGREHSAPAERPSSGGGGGGSARESGSTAFGSPASPRETRDASNRGRDSMKNR